MHGERGAVGAQQGHPVISTDKGRAGKADGGPGRQRGKEAEQGSGGALEGTPRIMCK